MANYAARGEDPAKDQDWLELFGPRRAPQFAPAGRSSFMLSCLMSLLKAQECLMGLIQVRILRQPGFKVSWFHEATAWPANAAVRL